MYPSSSSTNCTHQINPVHFSGQTNVEQLRPFFNLDHVNPNSKFDDQSLLLTNNSVFQYSSPCIQYEDPAFTWQHELDQYDTTFLYQQQFMSSTTDPVHNENSLAEIVNHMDDLNTVPSTVHGGVLKQDSSNRSRRGDERTGEKSTRKRISNKDRHSKINTARGPRDRRMRLSLPVARKFFDLQDALGFDKASKTVEWLLIQSNSAIKEVQGAGLQPPRIRHMISRSSVGASTSTVCISSTSEGEVVSGIEDSIRDTTNDHCSQSQQEKKISAKMKAKSSSKKEKKAKQVRRSALNSLARESRKVARERARKRTMEKRKLGESARLCFESATDRESWGSFKAVEGSKNTPANDQNIHINPSNIDQGLNNEVEEFNSQERRLSDILLIPSNWNPSSVSNYQQDIEMSNSHQFSEFPFCGKAAWDYDNMSAIDG